MSHDPYAPPGRRHARRAIVPPPPDPAHQVPGNEDEALAWMLAGDRGDRAELARRVDLAEAIETSRPGRMRARIMDEVVRLRGVITDDTAEWPEPVDPNAPTTPADPPVPDAPEAPAPEPAEDTVPETAADVVAWIRDAADSTTAGQRAAQAWAVEVTRADGIRSTVRAECDKHLD